MRTSAAGIPADYAERLPPLTGTFTAGNGLHATSDVASFAGRSAPRFQTGRPYNNHFVSIVTIEGGKVKWWSDYLDPVAVFDAASWPQSQGRDRVTRPSLPSNTMAVVPEDSLLERTIQRSVYQRNGAVAEEPEELVEATFRLIAETGNVDPNVRDILREAGISTQAFYRYFTSKDELMLVVLDAGRRRLATYLENRMNRHDDPLEQISEWIAGVIHQCEVKRASARTRPFMLHKGGLEARFPDEYALTESLLRNQLTTAITRGIEMRLCETSDPDGDAQIIYDYTMTHMSRHLVRRINPDPDLVRRLTSFAFRALSAPPDRI
jgi:AcrR family transcriptional regulator